MWGVCSGLRLRKPLAAVGGTSSPSLTSASHHYLSNGQKGNDGLPVSPTETLYFFGGNNVTEWNSLFQHYESPPYVLPHSSRAYSFGIAGQTAFLFSPFSRDFQIKKSLAIFASRPWNWSSLSLARSWICRGHLWKKGDV